MRGRRQAEFHLQPVGGASPAACRNTVRALGDKRSTAHVELVKTGALEAMVVVAGWRAAAGPLGALRGGLGLELD